MRHRVDHRKLGRTHAHRQAMLANMVTSLFDKSRITTTEAKAKEARRSAERLITRAKKGYAAYQESQTLSSSGKDADAMHMKAVALAHWRQASRVIKKRNVLKKLFDELAPKYMERPGGYTRILRLGFRPGDNARTVMLELVSDEVVELEQPPAKGKKKSTKKTAEKASVSEAAEAAPKPKAKAKAKKKKAKAKAKAKDAGDE